MRATRRHEIARGQSDRQIKRQFLARSLRVGARVADRDGRTQSWSTAKWKRLFRDWRIFRGLRTVVRGVLDVEIARPVCANGGIRSHHFLDSESCFCGDRGAKRRIRDSILLNVHASVCSSIVFCLDFPECCSTGADFQRLNWQRNGAPAFILCARGRETVLHGRLRFADYLVELLQNLPLC